VRQAGVGEKTEYGSGDVVARADRFLGPFGGERAGTVGQGKADERFEFEQLVLVGPAVEQHGKGVFGKAVVQVGDFGIDQFMPVRIAAAIDDRIGDHAAEDIDVGDRVLHDLAADAFFQHRFPEQGHADAAEEEFIFVAYVQLLFLRQADDVLQHAHGESGLGRLFDLGQQQLEHIGFTHRVGGEQLGDQIEIHGLGEFRGQIADLEFADHVDEKAGVHRRLGEERTVADERDLRTDVGVGRAAVVARHIHQVHAPFVHFQKQVEQQVDGGDILGFGHDLGQAEIDVLLHGVA